MARSSSSVPAIGETFSGRYRVERVVGEGGVGYVVAARHLELGEPVALKFLRREYLNQPEVVARFAREAKAAVYVKSEYSAQVFDVGTSERYGPFIVMELIDGSDLETVLRVRGALPARRAVEYVLQACEALALAHAAGILHRDIKPANLVLTRRTDGTEAVKLVDFGISKSALGGVAFGGGAQPLAETTTLIGSPMYMAPEQVRRNACDQRTDIWAMGLVLYELLSGQPGFMADSIPEICALILETSPAPLHMLVEDIPPELDAIVLRCLEKEPEHRFANLAELAHALLPFAPSRSRISVERITSVLRSSGQSMPVVLGSSSAPPPAQSMPKVAIPPSARVPTVPSMHSMGRSSGFRGVSVPSTQVTLVPSEARPQRIWLVAVGLLALGAAAGFFVMQRARVPAAEAAPVAANIAVAPKVTNERARVALIESDPADAVVEWNGLVLGRTPLTASLPVGPCTLVFNQAGFGRETVNVLLTDAPEGAEPVRVRARLTADRKGAPAGAAQLPAAALAAAAPLSGKSAPTTHASRWRAPPRESATPLAMASAPPPSQSARPAPTAEEKRVHLVDEGEQRVRIVDDGH